MQIDFASSGGVVNRELTCHIETKTLDQGPAKELEGLVESTGAFGLRQEDVNPNVGIGRADVITYRLSLSEGARHVTLWLNDINAPASIRPLLARLQELAREQKGK